MGSYEYDCTAECGGLYFAGFGIDDSLIYPQSGKVFISCLSVAVKNIDPEYYFTIYPQPSDDYFTVSLSSLPANTSLSVFNIIGQQVYQQNLNERNTLINTYQIGVPGIYIAKLTDGKNNSYIKKVIIQ